MQKTIKIIMLLTLTTLITPCVADTVRYSKWGDTTFGSDGSVITEWGGDVYVKTPDDNSRKSAEAYIASQDADDDWTVHKKHK